MLITCTNRGCLKMSEAKLDKKTNEVICQECGKSIINLTESIRKALASFGQVQRLAEQKSFQVRCATCKTQRDFTLEGDLVRCATCGEELHPSAVFLNTYKQYVAQSKKEE